MRILCFLIISVTIITAQNNNESISSKNPLLKLETILDLMITVNKTKPLHESVCTFNNNMVIIWTSELSTPLYQYLTLDGSDPNPSLWHQVGH